ncbi:MAG: hypothetical protein IJU15_05000 [Synergistaceae bacterium]|nr:hypothetical protein [Synergistaceae bacterium]
MRLIFPDVQNLNFTSSSQRIRVVSELWFRNEMYCPACGCDSLTKMPNNAKVADFYCDNCGEIYELKSKGSPIGKSILDGAYYTALERITSSTNPNLFVLRYEKNAIESLTLVPKYFFTPDVLKMRNPLSAGARRAGYTGSYILYCNIPVYGKIHVVESHTEINKSHVIESYLRSAKLRLDNMNLRGWMLDILLCLDKITHEIFSLNDVYKFKAELAIKHAENRNITAKIRQQLQFLRDKGFIEFLGHGVYRKI